MAEARSGRRFRGGRGELRVGVLARNAAARRLYLDAAFEPHLEILCTRW